MLLDVTCAIQSPGTEFPFSLSQEIAPQEVLGEQVVIDTATLNGFFSGVGESIYVRGTISTVAHAGCANCMAPAQSPIEVTFSEVFLHEEKSDDPDRFTYEGSKIDLTDLAMSLTVLSLPMRFMCKEDCKGLCGKCGKDKDHCTCQKELPARQHPFAALQQLLTKDEEV